jgi:hypothetical protein
MSEQMIDRVLQIAEAYVTAEYQLGREALTLHQQAAGNRERWDAIREDYASINLYDKYLKIDLSPGSPYPNPGCFIYRNPLDEDEIERTERQLKKRLVYKASLFAHDEYEFVVRVMVSKPLRRFDSPSDIWDFIVKDDQVQLVNSEQGLCPDCDGMSRFTGASCTCEHNGFVHPPTIEVSGLNTPLMVRRLLSRPKRFNEYYDAEC